MKMKKKDKKLIWIIVGVALAIFLFGKFMDKQSFLILVPIPGSPCGDSEDLCLKSPLGSGSPFVCPDIAEKCNVKAVMNCTTPTGVDQVIARTDDNNFEDDDGWFATYNPISGGLTGWCYHSSGVRSGVSTDNSVLLPYDMIGYISTSTYTCRNEECLMVPYSDGYIAYSSCISGPDLDPNPKYGCVGKERCDEESRYNCGVTVQKSNQDFEVLEWSNSYANAVISRNFDLNRGEILNATSGTYDQLYVKYNLLEDVQQCRPQFSSICKTPEKTGYYACVNGNIDEQQFTPCTENKVCKEGTNYAYCDYPIDFEAGATDSIYNPIKIGFTSKEEIYIKADLISQTINRVDIKAEIKDERGSTYLQKKNIATNQDISYHNPVYYKIDMPEVPGTYYIHIYAAYNNKEIQLDENDEIYFRLSSDLSCSIDARNSLGGVVLRKDNIINAKLNTLVGNAKKDVDNVTITKAKIGTTNIDNLVLLFPRADGEYVYQFTPNVQGTLELNFEITKDEVTTDCPAAFSVSNPGLSFSGIMDNPNVNGCIKISNSNQNINIHIKDTAIDDFINVDSLIVRIYPPGCVLDKDCSQDLDLTTNNLMGIGKYSWSYDFSKRGTYYFEFIAVKEGYPTKKSDTRFLFEVKDDCLESECSNSNQCASGEICSQGKCKSTENKSTKYLLIGLIALIAVVAGFIIFKLFKKRSEPSIGLGGM